MTQDDEIGERVITVRGQRVDLAAVYREMVADSQSVSGQRVHKRGLKYVLGRMYGLPADHRTPTQPLRAMREEVVSQLQRLGWIEPIPGKNNGHYILRR